jgi:hypothetical protein
MREYLQRNSALIAAPPDKALQLSFDVRRLGWRVVL